MPISSQNISCFSPEEHPQKLAKKDVMEYLTEMTSSLSELESFNPSLLYSDVVPSSNPDSPLVSFDLWSDLEEEITNHVESLVPEREEFTVQESFTSCTDAGLAVG